MRKGDVEGEGWWSGEGDDVVIKVGVFERMLVGGWAGFFGGGGGVKGVSRSVARDRCGVVYGVRVRTMLLRVALVDPTSREGEARATSGVCEGGVQPASKREGAEGAEGVEGVAAAKGDADYDPSGTYPYPGAAVGQGRSRAGSYGSGI